jgi:hypothetical protein
MSIYVSIASYEDPFLARTIKSCLDNADNPDDIYFGIATFYEKVEKPDISFVHPDKIICLESSVSNRPGLQKTRSVLRMLMRDHDYFLQIDSHSFFLKGWDTNLINDLQELKDLTHEKVILSKYLSTDLGHYNKETIYKWQIGTASPNPQMKRLGLDWYTEVEGHEEHKILNKFYKAEMMAGGFIFCDKNFIKEQRYNGLSEMLMEETYDSFIAYLMGYDIYYTKHFNNISHDNVDYNQIVYGEKHVLNKSLSSEVASDSLEASQEMYYNFFFNDSLYFKVLNAKRTPYSWWKELGFEQFYLEKVKNIVRHNFEK